MNLQQILDEVTLDSKIDMLEIGRESARIPSLHSKYLTYRANEKLILKKLNIEYSSAYKERWLFYSGKATPEQYKAENFDLKVMRGDIDIFITADKKLAELKSKIAVQEMKVETLEEYIKQLNQRHWMLSNAIKWQQIMSGGL
jgi:hypothetical protein